MTASGSGVQGTISIFFTSNPWAETTDICLKKNWVDLVADLIKDRLPINIVERNVIQRWSVKW